MEQGRHCPSDGIDGRGVGTQHLSDFNRSIVLWRNTYCANDGGKGSCSAVDMQGQLCSFDAEHLTSEQCMELIQIPQSLTTYARNNQGKQGSSKILAASKHYAEEAY